ncbi:MAG: hypothetical protein F6J98_02050 [Moorea sp. SIO4G2]|nr:hypothetical protein [Moorena sp. SIO4G2]
MANRNQRQIPREKIVAVANELHLYVENQGWHGVTHMWNNLQKLVGASDRCETIEILRWRYNYRFETNLEMLLTSPEPFRSIHRDIGERYWAYRLESNFAFQRRKNGKLLIRLALHPIEHDHYVNELALPPVPRSRVFNWFIGSQKSIGSIYHDITKQFPSQRSFGYHPHF